MTRRRVAWVAAALATAAVVGVAVALRNPGRPPASVWVCDKCGCWELDPTTHVPPPPGWRLSGWGVQYHLCRGGVLHDQPVLFLTNKTPFHLADYLATRGRVWANDHVWRRYDRTDLHVPFPPLSPARVEELRAQGRLPE